MKVFSILFLVFFLLTGCSKSNYIEEMVEDTYSINTSALTPYNLYIENTDYTLSKYEPTNSAYIGVYLNFENNPREIMEDFENNINNYHTIYSCQLKLDEEFPLDFILACYSKNKIPFVTILPPENLQDTFSTELLINLSKEFGKFKIPIFLNFYENSNLTNYNTDDYINFFKQAKKYFEIYASNVAFVWSVDSSNIYEIEKYYPGDNYVDWVGINIYENVTEDNEIEKILTEIDYFYQKFQTKKPICISSLGISHFNNKTFSYVIEDKIDELTRFYNTIPEKYPRIKCINYLNYDNFSINENKKILSTYNILTKNSFFTQNLKLSTDEKSSLELEKLSFLVYKEEIDFYIEMLHIEDLCVAMEIEDFSKEDFEVTTINGVDYYNLKEIIDFYNLSIEANEDNKFVVMTSFKK